MKVEGGGGAKEESCGADHGSGGRRVRVGVGLLNWMAVIVFVDFVVFVLCVVVLCVKCSLSLGWVLNL